MKLGTKGVMAGFNNQNFIRSTGVPASVAVTSPKQLSTATKMSAPKSMGRGNNAQHLLGKLTHNMGGGLTITR